MELSEALNALAAALAAANALVVIPESVTGVPEGATVDVMPL